MANAAATQNCILDHSYDDLSYDEFSNIDSSLVMSLLDGDDEMVRLMTESLEAKIVNQCSSLETKVSNDSDDHQDQMGSICSTSDHDHPGFEWVDMEMAYSCPSDEISASGYFAGRFGAEFEFEGLEDYSQVWYDQMLMPMEMEEEDNYIGLWQ